MTEAEESLAALMGKIEGIPFAAGVTHLYEAFRELTKSDYRIASATWLSAFELAFVAKWVYLKGHNRKDQRADWSSILNAYKKFWAEVEAEVDYPDDPEVVASFVLRFAYQQLPWHITRTRMDGNFKRVQGLFAGASSAAATLRERFENSAGVSLGVFLKISHVLYGIFLRTSSVSEYELIDLLWKTFRTDDVSATLKLLTATRGQFRRYYEQHCAANNIFGLPYELNPLLRYPVMLHDQRFWCVFPELVNYASTRGLYFLIADLAGPSFGEAFSDAFEEYVQCLFTNALFGDQVITEKYERTNGWDRKTNDLTILLGDSAILFECKNSGLFSLSKKSGMPADLATDIRKNLANIEKRKGLFQIYDKIESIRAGLLPEVLKSKYAGVKKFYPVILLYDQLSFANRGETLRNLIDKELKAGGVVNFDYQIWHVEEVEFLLKAVPKNELLAAVEEKFTNAYYKTIDLSSYLSAKFGLTELDFHLFTPTGESNALKILRTLSDPPH